MNRAGDGTSIVIYLCVGYLLSAVLGGTIPCNTHSGGTTSGSDCELTTSSTEKPDENERCCNTILYIIIVGFGILTLPAIVCTRVCWIKKLRKREQRRLDDVRNRQREAHEQSVYTIEPDLNICEFISSPPPYDVIATPDDDAPPPYDLPPPYSSKENEKDAVAS